VRCREVVFVVKFMEKGTGVGGQMRGGNGLDPSWLPAVPGPENGEGGLTPNTGPAALVPSPFTELQMGQASGTALPPRTRTQARRDTQLPQC